jgi:hypothetical protein
LPSVCCGVLSASVHNHDKFFDLIQDNIRVLPFENQRRDSMSILHTAPSNAHNTPRIKTTIEQLQGLSDAWACLREIRAVIQVAIEGL